MNKRIPYMLLPVFLVCFIPAVLLLTTGRKGNAAQYEISLTSEPPTTVTIQTTEQTVHEKKQIYVSVLMEDVSIMEMSLEEYICGVVLAEMPHWFEYEALKAQAVVARTYTLRRSTGNQKHRNADICTDPSCCQAYCDTMTYLENGGTAEQVNKIERAVADTENAVLVYDGKLIEATYFSCSGGATEDAAAVWGADVPYLQSIESPGEENAEHHTDSVYFSSVELEKILGRSISGNVETWFGEIKYTKGGGVDTIEIGGKTYLGTELRRLLGLRSTAFSVATIGNTILFVTKGYGHRVGMSQYGADAMAASGKTFSQILSHYYSGAELVEYNP